MAEMNARSLIGALHAAGWTNAAIGRAVGRNDSLIYQGATGKKPLNNLLAALDALAASGQPGPKSAKAIPPISLPPTPRRVRASGQPARVRQPRQRPPQQPGEPTPRATRSQEPPAQEGKGRGGRGQRQRGRPPARESEAPEAAKAVQLPNGQRVIEGHTTASARFAANIADGMSDSARIRISYLGEDGQWHSLFRKGGISPEALRGYTRGGVDWMDALEEMIADHYAGGTTPDASGAVEFYVVMLGAAS